MKLSAQQIAIAVLTTKSLSAAAEQLQISRNTLSAYLKQKRVQDEIDSLLIGQRHAFRVQQQVVFERAMQTLMELLTNSDAKIQIKACELSLNKFYNATTADEIKIIK